MSNQATIEEAILHMKAKYSDVGQQIKFLKILIDKVKSQFGENDCKTFPFVADDYQGVLTVFLDGSNIMGYWELYHNGIFEASGIEKYSTRQGSYSLLYSSSPEYNKYMFLPKIMSNL